MKRLLRILCCLALLSAIVAIQVSTLREPILYTEPVQVGEPVRLGDVVEMEDCAIPWNPSHFDAECIDRNHERAEAFLSDPDSSLKPRL